MKKTRKLSDRRARLRVVSPADLGQVLGGHEVGVIELVGGDDPAGGAHGRRRRGDDRRGR